MRLWWNHIWKSQAYRRGSAAERREIEIRFRVARVLKQKRRSLRVTQHALAKRMGMAQSTLSRVERASNRVSLDVAIRSLIALDCSDAEIASAFNAGDDHIIAMLRRRANDVGYPVARPSNEPPRTRDHRFLKKGAGPNRARL
jgi:transcriptional regulator with XRE-family HTH domain